MSYDGLRHFADSWGLVMMGVFYALLVGWAFRRGGSKHNDAAANMIFKDDEHV
jgi:cytochrome c oxidase cbb3-type subunit IV